MNVLNNKGPTPYHWASISIIKAPEFWNLSNKYLESQWLMGYFQWIMGYFEVSWPITLGYLAFGPKD